MLVQLMDTNLMDLSIYTKCHSGVRVVSIEED